MVRFHPTRQKLKIMYNKQSTNQYLNIPVMMTYKWNGSQNSITGVIHESHYFVLFRKIESHNKIKIRYSQIVNIELLENMEVIRD